MLYNMRLALLFKRVVVFLNADNIQSHSFPWTFSLDLFLPSFRDESGTTSTAPPKFSSSSFLSSKNSVQGRARVQKYLCTTHKKLYDAGDPPPTQQLSIALLVVCK